MRRGTNNPLNLNTKSREPRGPLLAPSNKSMSASRRFFLLCQYHSHFSCETAVVTASSKDALEILARPDAIAVS